MAGRADMISNRRHVQRAMQAFGLVALLSLAVGAVLTASGAFAGGLAASSVEPAYAPILDDTPTPTSTPDPCDPVWSAVSVSSPNGGAHSNVLNDVAVVTANDVWAVGYYTNCHACATSTLVEHWDGTSWSVVSSPNVAGKLLGVAAVSANDVWAVGEYDGRWHTLVEHWDGTSWSVVSSPIAGTGENSLYGVAAVSANDVWAVGYYCNSCGPYQTLIEHWDGTSWSVVPSPNVGILYGVAAVSANDVWAVGFYCNNSNCLSGPFNTLIEHWDGTSWSVVPSPNVGTENRLWGVATVSANDVWAVGSAILHWDGTSWSVVPSPNIGGLNAVAAVSANDVWAVGQVGDIGNSTLTEHWDGTSWSVVSGPNPCCSYSLRGIAAAAADDVWAVGGVTPYSGQPLVGHYASLCGTPTNTPTSTSTLTPTITRTPTNTPLCAPNCTATPTSTPTNTRTFTSTRTNTLTRTITRTPTNTLTPCASCTPTPTNTPIFAGPPIPGDVNSDHVVDAIDWPILRTYFNWSCGFDLLCIRADLYDDGFINLLDLQVHRINFTQGSPNSPVPPSSGDAFLSLQPGTSGNCSAPANGGTVQVGCRFVLDLMVNMGSVPDGVAMQGYMTFTSSILQNARVSSITSSCVPTNTVTLDSTYFEAFLANEVCHGSGPCYYAGPGTISVARGTFGAECPTGCSGTFRVARIGWCAVASGQAVFRWQFSPPAPRNRHSAIVDVNGNMVQDQSLFTDYIINITECPGCTNTPTYTPTNIPTFTPTRTRTSTPTPIYTFTPCASCTNTPTYTPTNTRTFTPTPTVTHTFTPGVCNNEPRQFLQPEAGAPPNGGTVNVGDRFVLDLMVDARDFAAPNGIFGQQSYMTFTADLLQNARVSDIGTSCVPTSTVTFDTSVFDTRVLNEVCNGPGQCNFRNNVVDPGSLAYGSAGFSNCPQGCPDPNEPPPLNQPVFRVAQIGFCAMAPGQAIIRWEFSPPGSPRITTIIAEDGTEVNNRACYTDYVINIIASTNTPTITPTPTPDSAILVGHVTIEGRPAQPNPLQSVPITLTLKVAGGAENNYTTNTDASGFFTITSPGPGLYDWRVKNPQTLANSGSVTLPSSGATQQEMGLLREGDANNDNCTNITDFNIVKSSFGLAIGDPGYDARADFNGDQTINIVDFSLLRGTFGQCGVDPIRPAP